MQHPRTALDTLSGTLSWREILAELRHHRAALLRGNVIAILAVLAAVPVPLILPLLVDEVLLGHPGLFIATFGPWFPEAWHGPVLFVLVALAVTVLLRLFSIVMNVIQSRTFRWCRRRWSTAYASAC